MKTTIYSAFTVAFMTLSGSTAAQVFIRNGLNAAAHICVDGSYQGYVAPGVTQFTVREGFDTQGSGFQKDGKLKQELSHAGWATKGRVRLNFWTLNKDGKPDSAGSIEIDGDARPALVVLGADALPTKSEQENAAPISKGSDGVRCDVAEGGSSPAKGTKRVKAASNLRYKVADFLEVATYNPTSDMRLQRTDSSVFLTLSSGTRREFVPLVGEDNRLYLFSKDACRNAESRDIDVLKAADAQSVTGYFVAAWVDGILAINRQGIYSLNEDWVKTIWPGDVPADKLAELKNEGVTRLKAGSNFLTLVCLRKR